MSSDDSLSPIMTMRHVKKSSSVTAKTPSQMQFKRDLASKLSLTRQRNAKENVDPKTPDTASKQKVSASLIFSSCKKKQLGINNHLPRHTTVLVGDSSDEEFIDGDSFNELTTDRNAEAIDDSLVEYSLIRKWLQNAEDSLSSEEEVVSDPDVSNFAKSVPHHDGHKSMPISSVVQDDTIFLSSDNDEDSPLKPVGVKPKMITTGSSTPILKPIIQQSLIKAPETSLLDSFDSPLVTKSLQDRLKEQNQPHHRPDFNKLLDSSSSDSECFSPITRPYKKTVHVLCSSSDDEVSSPPKCGPPSFKGRESKSMTKRDSIPKTIPESESELEDVFVSLTINEAPSVKPKKLIKPRQKKKTQNPAAFIQLDSKSQRSFLASLSSDVPQECRHPDAIPFLKNFRKHRDELTNRLFLMFNDEIFNNFFEPNFSITWNARLTRTAGYCRHFTRRENGAITFESRIELSVKVVDTPCRLRDTLVHELCHAATWVIDNCRGGHGPVWRKWANQALDVYPELPPITRCHNYEITYKFYYNCVNCKYSAGRHSKSIDTTTHVCPMCRGKLELSKEPTSKVGAGVSEELSTPKAKTPRTPNAFALFVKDNYATVKSSRSDLPHAAVMRMLSAKFAESKKQVV